MLLTSKCLVLHYSQRSRGMQTSSSGACATLPGLWGMELKSILCLNGLDLIALYVSHRVCMGMYMCVCVCECEYLVVR